MDSEATSDARRAPDGRCGCAARCRRSGFVPRCSCLAERLGLAGSVRNDARRRVDRDRGRARRARRLLRPAAAPRPPRARIESLEHASIATARRDPRFASCRRAAGEGGARAPVPIWRRATACLAELADPTDRRYRYPFINCTDCGPRFTIIREVPYDRARTTMARFALCAACRARIRRPARPALSRRAERLSRLRAAAALAGARPGAARRRGGAGGGGQAIARRRDRRDQGRGRVPARRRCARTRRGGAAARAQAARRTNRSR